MKHDWIKIGTVLHYRGSGPDVEIISVEEISKTCTLKEGLAIFQMTEDEIIRQNYVPWYAGPYFGFEY